MVSILDLTDDYAARFSDVSSVLAKLEGRNTDLTPAEICALSVLFARLSNAHVAWCSKVMSLLECRGIETTAPDVDVLAGDLREARLVASVNVRRMQ